MEESVRRSRRHEQGSLLELALPVSICRLSWSEEHTLLLYYYYLEEVERGESEVSLEKITQKLKEKGSHHNLKSVKEKLRGGKRIYSFWKDVANNPDVKKDGQWWGKQKKDFRKFRDGPPQHLDLLEKIFEASQKALKASVCSDTQSSQSPPSTSTPAGPPLPQHLIGSDDSVLFINAGGAAIKGGGPHVKVSDYSFFEGGDIIEPNESIFEGDNRKLAAENSVTDGNVLCKRCSSDIDVSTTQNLELGRLKIELNKEITEMQNLVAQCEDLKLKYYEEMDKRKNLHNIVQERKGNIRVFCRCRPLSKDEVSSGQKCVVDFEASNDGVIVIANGGATKKTFKFDRVFTPKDDQDVVYADASPLVTSVLDGYNVCIFAYGQTGTGKTFTMEGTERNRGVNYRTLEDLFKIAEERKESVMYDLSVSVLEVYNEQIRDLLDTSPSKKLEIKQSSEGQNYVPGLVEAKIGNIKEVWDVLRAGSNARAVSSNNVNEHSSRSHCMLCIMVRAKNLLNGECTSSKLWLVDLAGSERLAKTGVQGERLKEAQNINRSLSELGAVISALATKRSHIPYRNSKLTFLLQDSLGGDSKALMFVQISPSSNDVSETTSSLNFASSVRRIELGPAKKQVDTVELQKTKQMLERAKQELRLQDDSLRKLVENLQNLETKAKGKEQLCKNLQEKVKELECQLESKAHSQSTSEKQQRQLSGKLKEKEEMCTSLQQNIKEPGLKLKEQEHDRSVVELNIKELELRLKEQEDQLSAAELKIKELELKLKEQEHQRSVAEQKAREIGHELLETQRTESLLKIKLRDLESKTKEQDTNMIVDSIDATPVNAKVPQLPGDEVMSEKENRILRSSNPVDKQLPLNENSSLPPVAPEAVNEKKRKGDARNASIGGEQENSGAPAGQNVGRKRSMLGEREARLKRKSTEPPQVKSPGRSTASSRAAPTSSRVARQQPGGSKTRRCM